jgi:hypothetical protein
MTDASEIIQAWTDELVRQQPNFGAITDETKLAVGPPPLLCDTSGLAGAEDVESELDVVYCLGFTRGLAAKSAEAKQLRATIHADEMTNLGNEAKLKEWGNRIAFWESVAVWVRASVPALTARDAAPEWLMALNPIFPDEDQFTN